jgi:hypothetical protein
MRRSKRRTEKLAPAGLAASVAALFAAAVGYTLKRRGQAGDAPAEDSAGGKRDRSTGGPEPQDWQCECGQEYRVSGEGRHRVYWLRDASPDDPVLEPQCPNCERPLPHEPQSVG